MCKYTCVNEHATTFVLITLKLPLVLCQRCWTGNWETIHSFTDWLSYWVGNVLSHVHCPWNLSLRTSTKWFVGGGKNEAV